MECPNGMSAASASLRMNTPVEGPAACRGDSYFGSSGMFVQSAEYDCSLVRNYGIASLSKRHQSQSALVGAYPHQHYVLPMDTLREDQKMCASEQPVARPSFLSPLSSGVEVSVNSHYRPASIGCKETVELSTYTQMTDISRSNRLQDSEEDMPSARLQYASENTLQVSGLKSGFPSVHVPEPETLATQPFTDTCKVSLNSSLLEFKNDDSAPKRLSEKENVLKTDCNTDNSDSEVKGNNMPHTETYRHLDSRTNKHYTQVLLPNSFVNTLTLSHTHTHTHTPPSFLNIETLMHARTHAKVHTHTQRHTKVTALGNGCNII